MARAATRGFGSNIGAAGCRPAVGGNRFSDGARGRRAHGGGQFPRRWQDAPGHLAGKAQRLAGERVVAIQVHLGALDLHHVVDAGLAIVTQTLQPPAHFDAGRKFAFGNAEHQALVARPEGLLDCQLDRGGVADGLAFQRQLHLGKNVVIAAMQVGCESGIQRLAGGGIRQGVAQGDSGVFGDGHTDCNEKRSGRIVSARPLNHSRGKPDAAWRMAAASASLPRACTACAAPA